MTLQPGSFPWFVAHDLRQSGRQFEAQFRGLSRARIAAILVGALLAMHALAWPVARWLDGIAASPGGEARMEMWFAAGVLASFCLILAQALTSAMRILYARGDFDLLLASPVSARAVLGSRALAVAFEAAVSAAMVLLPLANMGAIGGRPSWLAIYPALLSSTLAAAGLGLFLAMAFFVSFGPRRARLLSQVAATLIGASFVLAGQAASLLPGHVRGALTAALAQPPAGSWFAHSGILWLPVRAALGEPAALLAWAVCGVSVFGLAIVVCGRHLPAAAALATGFGGTGARERGERAFRGGLGPTLRAKERRLIRRDPWLLSQILLQIVYTLPISVVLWRNGGTTGSPGVAIAPWIVVIAAQLAGSLAWVALSGEDASEFLATAPVRQAEIDRRKIEAIALPVAVVLAVPVFGLAWASPWGALCAIAFATGAGISTALVNLWRQTPGRRGMVLRRHSQSKLLALLELVLTLLWAVACAVAVIGSWAFVLPLGLAALVLWLSRPRRARHAAIGMVRS